MVELIKREPKIIGELIRLWDEMDLISSFGITLLNSTTYPEFVRLNFVFFLCASIVRLSLCGGST